MLSREYSEESYPDDDEINREEHSVKDICDNPPLKVYLVLGILVVYLGEESLEHSLDVPHVLLELCEVHGRVVGVRVGATARENRTLLPWVVVLRWLPLVVLENRGFDLLAVFESFLSWPPSFRFDDSRDVFLFLSPIVLALVGPEVTIIHAE